MRKSPAPGESSAALVRALHAWLAGRDATHARQAPPAVDGCFAPATAGSEGGRELTRGEFLRMRGSLRLLPQAGLAIATCVAAAATVIAQPEFAWSRLIDIASGPGERGEWRQNESQWDYVDDPTVALQPNGAAAVAWVDQRRKDVLFQIYERDGKPRLKEPVDVSRNPAMFSWLPRIALSPDRPNEIYILWQEIVFSGGSHGGDIFFARSQDGGASFAEPLNLSKSVGGDGKGRKTSSHWDNGSLDIAVGTGGKICAAWTEYHGTLWFSRSDDHGATFSEPSRAAGGDRPTRAPSLGIAPDGTVYLAWATGEDPRADIRIARSENGGRSFAEAAVVARTADYSDSPQLAIDRKGTIHLVYTERSWQSWRRGEIHYARSTDGGRTFVASGAISRPHPEGAPLAAYPALALNERGDLFALWELYRDARSGGRGLAIAVSRDAGQTFSAPAAVPGSVDPAGGVNGSNQGKLMRRLAVHRDGSVAVVNSSLSHGQRSRVWLMRGQ